MKRFFVPILAVTLCALAPAASAGLVGSSVAGFLSFNGGGTNFFNSSNGFVPPGCQNSGLGSTTVTIVNPTPEFCFRDPANTDTANFTDSALTYTDVSAGGGGPQTLRFTFQP